jgi:hypothetical protein
MTDGPEVNEDYSRKVADLLRLIERLPADRQEQLRRELAAGTLDIEGLRRAAEGGKR